MRIQHNIAAMNAYRNYNTNTSAVSKNLEKLSSGYKINRAGDDAAGLAISEKMRAQISGLQAASKNVKDGISLVKTAEGAMQEVQDMLNRMVTLATQSANGTYDNEVDRLNLQKEVDQLRSEINRIADSSNFNGIKLMDGSQEIKTSYNMASPTVTGADEAFNIVADGQLGVDAQAGVFSFDMTQLKVTTVSPEIIKEDMDSGAITFTDGSAAAEATYAFSLDGLEIDTTQDTTLTFKIGSKEYAVDIAAATTEETAQETLDRIGAALIAEINNDKPTGTSSGDFTATYASGTVTLTAANQAAVAAADKPFDETTDKVTVTGELTPEDRLTSGTTASNGSFTAGAALPPSKAKAEIDLAGLEVDTADGPATVTFTIGDKTYEVEAAQGDDLDAIGAKLATAIGTPTGYGAAAYAGGKVTLEAAATGVLANPFDDAGGTSTGNIALSVTATAPADSAQPVNYQLSLGGNKFAIQLDGGTEYTGADLAQKIADVLNGKTDSATVLDENGNEITDLGEFVLGGVSFTANANSGVLTITMDEAPKEWESADEDNLTLEFHYNDKVTNNGGEQFKARVDIEAVDSTRERQYAQATLDLSKLNIKDGSSIQIGNTTYTFAIGSDSRFKNAANVVDLTDKTMDNFDATGDDSGIKAAANRLSKVAASNSTFFVGSDTNGIISLTEKEGAVDYAKNNLAGKENDGTAGRPDGVTANVNDWKGLVKTGQASISGTGLTLQIGDTSDSYNQLTVSIGDIHTKALGINNIDISTQAGAQSAINSIRTAINSVSSIRGTLGATQNRLEHTANNLSVMTENIQDAESTIRDTDIAEEMMAYTKNNILVQSAQAMLAQANQIPQGVLQLLG